jgi:hypothetical protein
MSGLLKRYLSGDHEAVWKTLGGSAVNFAGSLGDVLTTADDPLVIVPLEYLKTAWEEWLEYLEKEREEMPFS